MKAALDIAAPAPEWRIEPAFVAYDAAVSAMEARARQIREEGAADLLWLLEHPPLYTAGTSANPQDLLSPQFPVHATGRGGQYTYHGPGQRVVYAMTDLQPRGNDLRRYIRDLEEWIILSLAEFGLRGARRDGRVGIWIAHPDGREDKIAAIGVRVRKWVAYHGFAVNVHPDLSHYDGIVPCGIRGHGVTSLAALGLAATLPQFDAALQKNWAKVFA